MNTEEEKRKKDMHKALKELIDEAGKGNFGRRDKEILEGGWQRAFVTAIEPSNRMDIYKNKTVCEQIIKKLEELTKDKLEGVIKKDGDGLRKLQPQYEVAKLLEPWKAHVTLPASSLAHPWGRISSRQAGISRVGQLMGRRSSEGGHFFFG